MQYFRMSDYVLPLNPYSFLCTHFSNILSECYTLNMGYQYRAAGKIAVVVTVASTFVSKI